MFEKRGRYPRFKRKDRRISFCAANETGTLCTDGKRIKLPVICWVKMREAVRFLWSAQARQPSCEAGRWFVALQIATDDMKPLLQPRTEVGDAAYGSHLVVANRWYPSSKTCCCCGVIKETLALSREDV